jgi:N-acetylmuramoyl-L-alanine amidase
VTLTSHLLALALVASAGPGDRPSEVFLEVKDAYGQLRADKTRRTQRAPYERVIKRLLDASAQPGDRADACAYLAATVAEDLWRESGVAGDLDRAVNLNVAVADRFGQSSLADDALWRAAKLLVSRKGDMAGARSLLVRAQRAYPTGDQAMAVKELLGRLPETAGTPVVQKAPSPVGRGPQPTGGDPPDRITSILARYAQEARDAGAEQGADASARVVVPSTAPPPAAQPVAAAQPIRVAKARSAGQRTEVALEVEGTVALVSGTAPAQGKIPWRFYVDVSPALVGTSARELKAYQDTRVQRVRVAQFNSDTVRVVVELKRAMTSGASYDPAAKRVVITLGAPAAEGAVAAAPAPAPAAPAKTAPSPATVDARAPKDDPQALADARTLAREMEKGSGPSLSAQAGLKVRRVVIDAGHGGEDPGAIGPTGVKEKDVTLQIAKKAAARIRKDLKMDVVLTRDRDVFLPLEERTAIANRAGADLFISIHANSNPNRRIHGVETYYLNITDDNYAMKLAARENRTSQRSISDLQFILADLAMKSNVDDSARLSRMVQASTVRELKDGYPNVRDLGVKHALFYVLIGAKMPAILVETSFISNRDEEKRLTQGKYQDKVAEGLVQGIRHFVEERQALAR